MCNCIQEAKKMIEEYRYNQNYHCAIPIELLIERLEKQPQEQTLDELLEEMPYGFTLTNMSTYWVAQTPKYSDTGDSPIEAIIAMKEKITQPNKFTLPNNPQ